MFRTACANLVKERVKSPEITHVFCCSPISHLCIFKKTGNLEFEYICAKEKKNVMRNCQILVQLLTMGLHLVFFIKG